MNKTMMPVCLGLSILLAIGGLVGSTIGAHSANVKLIGNGCSLMGMSIFFIGAAITASVGDA